MKCLLLMAFNPSVHTEFTEPKALQKKKPNYWFAKKFNYSQSNTACSLAGNSIVIIIIAIIVSISIELVPSNNANVVKYTACYDRVWGSPMILVQALK